MVQREGVQQYREGYGSIERSIVVWYREEYSSIERSTVERSSIVQREEYSHIVERGVQQYREDYSSIVQRGRSKVIQQREESSSILQREYSSIVYIEGDFVVQYRERSIVVQQRVSIVIQYREGYSSIVQSRVQQYSIQRGVQQREGHIGICSEIDSPVHNEDGESLGPFKSYSWLSSCQRQLGSARQPRWTGRGWTDGQSRKVQDYNTIIIINTIL